MQTIVFSPELLADPDAANTLSLQRQLFNSRAQALATEQAGLRETIAGFEAQLRGTRASQASKVLQRAALNEQLQGLRELAREGYIPRNRLLDSERLYAQIDGAIAEDFGRIGQLQRQVLELRLRIRQLGEDFQKDLRSQLAETRTRSDDLRNRLASAEFELANSLVRAPASGVVVGLQVYTEGGVIQPGQTLMDIVPEGEPLLVEARVPVQMIDKVHPGLPVELMFSAFNQSTTPRVAGEVTLVSADRQVDERTDEPYYTLRAQVSAAGMQQLHGVQIRPACQWKPSSRPVSVRCSTICSNPCWIAPIWPWWKNEGIVVHPLFKLYTGGARPGVVGCVRLGAAQRSNLSSGDSGAGGRARKPRDRSGGIAAEPVMELQQLAQ